MKLTIGNFPHPTELNTVGWVEIEESLSKLDSINKSFLILTKNDGSYIQCAGGNDRLTVEFREVLKDSFKHFIIGKGIDQSPLKTVWTQIDCNAGPIRVHNNEVLNLEESTLIFKSFFENNKIPDEFKKRNITKTFLK